MTHAQSNAPDEGLKYGLDFSRSSSHVWIFVVHESRVSLGMSIPRAAISSLWVADCVRASAYFFARSVPGDGDQIVVA
jgi:hypothetical protein